MTEIAIPDPETEIGGTGASATTILKVSARNEALEKDPVSRIGHNEEIEAKVTMGMNVGGIGGIQVLTRIRVLSLCTEDCNLKPISQMLRTYRSKNSATYPSMNLLLNRLVTMRDQNWWISLSLLEEDLSSTRL